MLFSNLKEKIRTWLKKFLFPQYSPYEYVVKNSGKVAIGSKTILLDSARFRFDVPAHQCFPAVVIGNDSVIACNFIFESTEGKISIGDRTYIGGGTNLIARTSIVIGNDVVISWGCYIYDHDSHSLNWQNRREDIKQFNIDYRENNCGILNKDWMTVKTKPIIIHDKVWIGFDVVILKGITIGEGAIVGAKSVVTKDVEPWTVVAGNPAKIVKRLNKEVLD